MRSFKIAAVFLTIFTFVAIHAVAQTNEGNSSDIELENISPIEKVGYKKLKMSHWVSHTEILIDASPEQVWSVLIDTESYPKWNEIILKMDGKIEDKGKVDVLFKAGPKAKPRLFHNTLFVKEGVEFYWSQVQAAGIKDRHCFRVEATDGGKTKFIQSDQALGGLTWLIGKTASKIQIDVYPMFNRSLKAEVERRYLKK
ncbi:MAG: SRPBCC domain-containing protein [Saprospiraceae bacterium]|nr:SRPBCC domain-containing protein [Saprospiraceae bacterium]